MNIITLMILVMVGSLGLLSIMQISVGSSGSEESSLRGEQHAKANSFSLVLVSYNDSRVYKTYPLCQPSLSVARFLDGGLFPCTVNSIMRNTSRELIGEILIIDDLSPNPIENIWFSPLVRIIRSDHRLGLIQARALGGDSALFPYIAIVDCHIRVAEGWLDEPLKLMMEDYRTLVNPTVLSLNTTNFEFTKSTSVMSSGGFSWAGDFFWGGSVNGTIISAITVGEFFITRRWWHEIEGMDDGMNVWGGENIDISIKTWLCGGNIKCAPTSIIAHHFGRDFSLPMPKNTVVRNLARSFEVWYGEEYIQKFYTKRHIKRGSIDIGDISKPMALKQKLKCHDFGWFVEKFKNVSPCEEGNNDKNRTCGKLYAVDWNQALKRIFP